MGFLGIQNGEGEVEGEGEGRGREICAIFSGRGISMVESHPCLLTW